MEWKTRGARQAEQIEVMRRLWTEDLVTFKGKFHTLIDVNMLPVPVQRPIPIWFGGSSDAVVKRAARIGDGWMPILSPEAAEPKLAALREHLKAFGRDPAKFGLEGWLRFDEADPQRWAAAAHGWQRLGAADRDALSDVSYAGARSTRSRPCGASRKSRRSRQHEPGADGHGRASDRRHHQRRHGPHGHDPAHGQSPGHRRRGRASARQRRPADPRADAGRPRRPAHREARGRAWRPALDDEARGGVRRTGPHLHGLRRHRRPAQARAAGDRRRQAHLHREADGAHGRRGDGAGATGRPRRPQARRHPGQAVPARLRQAFGRSQVGLLRPHPVGEDRRRLVDLRRQRAGMPAAELELQEGAKAAGWRSI